MKRMLLMILALAMMTVFAAADGMPAGAEAYEGTWQCDRASIEMRWEEEGFRVLIRWGSSAWEHSEWEYSCFYQEDGTLVSMPFGTRTDYVYGDDGELARADVVYDDGTAAFSLDEDGCLIWEDGKEQAGADMRFERLPEEEPLFATFGEALEAGGEEAISMGYGDRYAVALEMDGQYIRVVTQLDSDATEILEASMAEEDFDKRLALQEAFHERLRALPVAYTEVITAAPLDQETLDGMIGKSYADLLDTNFDLYYGTIRYEWLEEEVDDWEQVEAILGARPAVIQVMYGMYLYDVTLNATRAEYEERSENEQLADLTITAVQLAGLSQNAADLEYQADGAYTGQTDLFDPLNMGEAGDLFSIITEAMNSGDGASMDPEALIDALIQLMPDREEEIRQLVPLLLMFSVQEEPAQAE